MSEAPDDPDDAPDAEWRVAAEAPPPQGRRLPEPGAVGDRVVGLERLERLPRLAFLVGVLGCVECLLAIGAFVPAWVAGTLAVSRALPGLAVAGAFGWSGWMLLHASGLMESALDTRDARALRRALLLVAAGGGLGVVPVLGVGLRLAWRWIGGEVAGRDLLSACLFLAPALVGPLAVAAVGGVAWVRLRAAWEQLPVPPSEGRAPSTPVELQPGREAGAGGVAPEAQPEHPE